MKGQDFTEYEKRRAEAHEEAWRLAATLVNIRSRHCRYRMCRRYQFCNGAMLPSPPPARRYPRTQGDRPERNSLRGSPDMHGQCHSRSLRLSVPRHGKIGRGAQRRTQAEDVLGHSVPHPDKHAQPAQGRACTLDFSGTTADFRCRI